MGSVVLCLKNEQEVFTCKWQKLTGLRDHHSNLARSLATIEIYSAVWFLGATWILTRLMQSLLCVHVYHLISLHQMYATIIHLNSAIYLRKMKIYKAFLSTDTSSVLATGRIQKRNKKRKCKRSCWVKPGRTCAWWDSFVKDIVDPEEWRENFLMSKTTVFRLCNELDPYIKG